MSLKLVSRAALLVVLFAIPALAAAQTPKPDPSAPSTQKQPAQDKSKNDAAYEALLKRVKDGDKTVDFKELRMAYADSSHYSPYGGDSDAEKAMFAALNSEKWDEALNQSSKILALLRLLGLRPTGQALINSGGHSYDKLTAVDPQTNDKYEFYFNIDKPFGWLGNSLKQ
jgi:hypothetical protein